MRSAERSLRLLCFGLGVASALLVGCTAIDLRGPQAPADAPKNAAAATPGAKAEPPPAMRAVEQAPISPEAQRAFDAARQALAAGRTAEAERGFLALTRSNPELSGSFANLGLIHREAGKTAEAVADLEKAVQLSPQRAELHSQLGLAHRMNGDFAKARASYEKAIALDAVYAPAVLNLGILHDLYLWDGERALELYERYMQLVPGGDEQVKRWISDLRNRSQKQNAAQRKEQG
ncbi:MAG: tetratricopeptide repeat protein [Burkholderiaceae bacterium]